METMTLQTETGRLLDLVINSLYTERDVFLRELVANASDALDRLRIESLSRPELIDDGGPLEIVLETDREARTLTVRDNGIGMSRDEVVSHIGTIARSGTREFEAGLSSPAGREHALDFIGRFGVGFYSSFMVASRVTVHTRRAGEARGIRWESEGDVEYTLSEVDDLPRGTSVRLHLKPANADDGIDDYTDQYVLRRIIKRYADFVTHPVVYVGLNDPQDAEPDSTEGSGGRVVLNSMKPIWTRNEAEVKPDEYREFYRYLTHDWAEPILRIAARAEGRSEYSTLLFVPSHAPYDLYYHGVPFGLQLYSQRMLIVENCAELLPRYLRFLKGVVDAADLPLNVSRQALQQVQQLTQIRRWLTRKALEALNRLRQETPDQYKTFWAQFGRVIKEGVSEDFDNRERLTPLLFFESSVDESSLTSLADYVARMKEGQTEIFYLAGESRPVIERSPHLEEVRARGYEVLYFTEPVDELLAQSLREFDGKRLRSAAKGALSFGGDEERERIERELAQQSDELRHLIDFLGTHLAAHVKAVKVSQRLRVSPACLSGDEFDTSPHIERLLLRGKGSGARSRRILELNPSHAIVKDLEARLRANAADERIPRAADLLFNLALLAEGSELPDPVAFNDLVTGLLETHVGRRPGDQHEPE